MRQLVFSLVLSVAASMLGTYLLRKAVSVAGGGDGTVRPPSNDAVVVVIPIVAGNSGNRFLSPSFERSLLFGRRRK